MILLGSADERIELSIVGYQYPDAKPSDWYDANWLMVRLKVGSAWESVDPAMLTTEAGEVAGWLRRAAVGLAEPTLEFIEPVLVFRVEEDDIGDRFYSLQVSMEMLPPLLRGLPSASVILRLSEDPELLRIAADKWEQEIAAFPVRGFRASFSD